MNGEAAGIDAQTHGVVDERERHDGEQHGERQQHQAYLGDVLVHAVDEVFLILHFAHLRVGFQLLRDELQRVAVGVVRLQRYLDRREERVHFGELARVGAQRLDAFAQCLLLADVLQRTYVRARLQLVAELVSLACRHIVLQHHRHHDVLLHIGRKIAGGAH